MCADSRETRVATRDERGRFLPGVVNRSPGNRSPDKEIVKAINNAATPERVEQLIVDAFEWCGVHKSVKGAVSLLQLVLSYQLGQPVKRVISAKLKVDDILGSVADMDEEQLEKTIDALYDARD